MNPRTLLVSTVALTLAAALPAAASSVARPATLSDSTVVANWTLDNGLRVVTRHVPRATAVAITLGYSIGTDDDPVGQEGLGQVLGELAFMAPSGDIPARSREDLDSQRPLGWSFPVSRRSTLFTEIARVDRFPGVLSQVATRMRGVQVTPSELADAVRSARVELHDDLFGPALGALYYQVREVGLGRKDEDILRRAAGKDLAKLTAPDAEREIRSRFVPANAVLSLAGNLESIDVPALVTNLFGSIPAGTPFRHAPQPALEARSRVMTVADLRSAAGVVGVIAPALDDTLHPSFYLNALLLGSHFNHVWLRDLEGVAPNRHHYAVFDEPDLMRIFPPPERTDTDAEALSRHVDGALSNFQALIVTREPYDELRQSVLWLLGGPMGSDLAARVPNEPALLHTLARAQAGRALWGGERFWAEYRARFERQAPGGLGHWLDYFKDRKHQVRLLMVPRR
ncbi:MAG: insulinase family protein [Candidatus Eisenbacteria bacterium]|uniref:Insulinase family protein n=1 Tax=Eiseniibacteriota bacterium TaxID=2212470 RepID=A0A538U9D4_UNCEI|nr:MAG: insulinase family protein [Candidatus Eisenbacteria bacterium]